MLSGNRNFEGRVHANVHANYLASPPLVVAYALLGKMTEDITTEPLGTGNDGKPVYLRDVWPTNKEIADIIAACLSREQFLKRYGEVTKGPKQWQAIEIDTGSETYRWSDGSTYVKNPPYFEGITMDPPPVGDIKGARILAELGDLITTDHISPAGSIRKASPAGDYLLERQVLQKDFNSYGARRGNHEIMMRGTFANIRIRNEMLTNVEGGMTKHLPSGEQMPIYDAAMRYKAEGVPLVVFGGKEYGTGSSRDWAAKGTLLLGIKAVIVESFERIHRSNLVGMGVLPLTFKEGTDRKSLGITGEELIDILGLEKDDHAADGAVAGDPPAERQGGHGAGDLPHRYGRRGRLLPPRRHPALRAARDGEGGVSESHFAAAGERSMTPSHGLEDASGATSVAPCSPRAGSWRRSTSACSSRSVMIVVKFVQKLIEAMPGLSRAVQQRCDLPRAHAGRSVAGRQSGRHRHLRGLGELCRPPARVASGRPTGMAGRDSTSATVKLRLIGSIVGDRRDPDPGDLRAHRRDEDPGRGLAARHPARHRRGRRAAGAGRQAERRARKEVARCRSASSSSPISART